MTDPVREVKPGVAVTSAIIGPRLTPPGVATDIPA
jgi:hypothetical protein